MIKMYPLLLCLLLCSCASYISRFHRRFDRYDKQKLEARFEGRYRRLADRRLGRRPHRERRQREGTLARGSRRSSEVDPYLKKLYAPKTMERKKRYKAADLNDDGKGGSLWINRDGSDKVDYFFSPNNKKNKNDIVLIHVYDKFKREIAQELKRAFPAPKSKRDDAKPKEEVATTAAAPASAEGGNAAVENQTGGEILDKISSIVIDEVNRDYLLLRGHKSVLYSKRKRMIEVQALVLRKSIDDDNIVKSDDILDSSIRVVK